MTNEISQNPRLSYTASYKGIVVGGMSEYHPEKVDFSLTRSIDYIEGETAKETQKRLDALGQVEELLIDSVEQSIAAKIKALKSRLGQR